MLKLVNNSNAAKTQGCAVTYRAGFTSPYATCPATCALNPAPDVSTTAIDWDYLGDLLAAVPHDGHSWTYTHFPAVDWAAFVAQGTDILRETGKPATVVNASVESVADAREALALGVPVVIALPQGSERRVWHLTDSQGRRRQVVRCPAQYQQGVNCTNCGGVGRTPLCARGDRTFVVAFYAHGNQAKAIGHPGRAGGCYAAGGNVRLHWEATHRAALREVTEAAVQRRPAVSDGYRLREWAESLPRGACLRHHVAGDVGKEWDT